MGRGKLKSFQELVLHGGWLGALYEASGFVLEDPAMHAVHLLTDLPPGATAFHLDGADQQQGKPAEHHMSANAIPLAVVHGPQVEVGLERPPRSLDLEQLLVPKCDVRGRERIIRGDDQVLPVEALLGLDFLTVQDRLTFGPRLEVSTECRMRHQLAHRFGVLCVLGKV